MISVWCISAGSLVSSDLSQTLSTFSSSSSSSSSPDTTNKGDAAEGRRYGCWCLLLHLVRTFAFIPKATFKASSNGKSTQNPIRASTAGFFAGGGGGRGGGGDGGGVGSLHTLVFLIVKKDIFSNICECSPSFPLLPYSNSNRGFHSSLFCRRRCAMKRCKKST